MIGFLIRLLFREKPETQQMRTRYRVTLDMTKVRPGMAEGAAVSYLMRIGFTPTGQPNVWKADERLVGGLPKSSILKSEKL